MKQALYPKLSPAVAGKDGWAQLEFTVPDIKPGTYSMVGTGTRCDGSNNPVSVAFVVRSRDDDDPGEYPPRGCNVGVDRGRFEGFYGNTPLFVNRDRLRYRVREGDTLTGIGQVLFDSMNAFDFRAVSAIVIVVVVAVTLIDTLSQVMRRRLL